MAAGTAMFTGIVSGVGTLQARHGARLSIACRFKRSSLEEGASIACDGCCLTITRVWKGFELGKGESGFEPPIEPRSQRRWILEICKRAGITPTVFARKAKLTPSTVNRFVNERSGAQKGLGSTTLNKLKTAALSLFNQDDAFEVQVSNETLARTTLGAWQEGRRINLERALGLGDELGGHLVTGHIDGRTRIIARDPDGESARFVLESPPEFAPFIAAKGSVALDGVSLTVNEVDGTRFGVNIIPYTLAHTTWQDLGPGDLVNLEVDLLARYVARLREQEGRAK